MSTGPGDTPPNQRPSESRSNDKEIEEVQPDDGPSPTIISEDVLDLLQTIDPEQE